MVQETCISCKKEFTVGKNAIHCENCKAWFCDDIRCGVEFNDECFPCLQEDYAELKSKGCHAFPCPTGSNGEFVADRCDECGEPVPQLLPKLPIPISVPERIFDN